MGAQKQSGVFARWTNEQGCFVGMATSAGAVAELSNDISALNEEMAVGRAEDPGSSWRGRDCP